MSYKDVFNKQRNYFNTNVTKEVSFRINVLNSLKEVIINNEELIYQALKEDLNKSSFESFITEIGFIIKEINYFIKNLKKLSKPKKVKTPLLLFPAKSYLYKEPYGTVLILSPWNYPFQLSIMPLVGAIASGNTVVLKPSPYAPKTSELIKNLINHNFKEELLYVITGTDEEADLLLDYPFDYIFFIGSTRVGKHVMEKASKHLTPVTLELGGKSPAIIVDYKDIELAAKRIAYGKLVNAGQTCIAPDYLLIKEENKADFIKYFFKYVKEFYNEPLTNPNYPKIISKRHYDRLNNYLTEGTVFGGEGDGIKLAPTIITEVDYNSKIMQEEIFGPILPIITYNDLNQVITTLKTKDKPLSLYIFSDNKKIINKVVNELSFGGGTVNDTLMHFANSHLGFGGVGLSGMNKYHGEMSFLTFTHQKAVVKRGKIDLSLRYLPSTKYKTKLTRRFFK